MKVVMICCFVLLCACASPYGKDNVPANFTNIAFDYESGMKFNYPSDWEEIDKSKLTNSKLQGVSIRNGVEMCSVLPLKKDNPMNKISEDQKLLISKTMLQGIVESKNNENLKNANIEEVNNSNIKGWLYEVVSKVDVNKNKDRPSLILPMVSYVLFNVKKRTFNVKCNTLGESSNKLRRLVMDISATVSPI